MDYGNISRLFVALCKQAISAFEFDNKREIKEQSEEKT